MCLSWTLTRFIFVRLRTVAYLIFAQHPVLMAPGGYSHGVLVECIWQPSVQWACTRTDCGENGEPTMDDDDDDDDDNNNSWHLLSLSWTS